MARSSVVYCIVKVHSVAQLHLVEFFSAGLWASVKELLFDNDGF